MKSSRADDATERVTYVLFPSGATSTTSGCLAARRAPATTVVALRTRRAAMTQSFHAACCAKCAQIAGGERLFRGDEFMYGSLVVGTGGRVLRRLLARSL